MVPDPPRAPTTASDRQLYSGTTTVGIAAADAVVVGADRRSSLGGRFVASRSAEKVHEITPGTAMAAAGGVGTIQTVTDRLRAETALYETRRGEPLPAEGVASLLSELLQSIPSRGLQVLLGGIGPSGPTVYTADDGGGTMTAPYAAGGSGMQLAYGVLEEAHEEDLPVEAARDLARRAIASASARDAASGDGWTLATVTDDGVALETGEVAS